MSTELGKLQTCKGLNAALDKQELCSGPATTQSAFITAALICQSASVDNVFQKFSTLTP